MPPVEDAAEETEEITIALLLDALEEENDETEEMDEADETPAAAEEIAPWDDGAEEIAPPKEEAAADDAAWSGTH